jgi:predicted  nucleic acid-binding Zn-ribbon protein
MADTKGDEGHPPQGWYPDPEDSSYLRRWDGGAWTDERVPASRGRRRLRAQDHPDATTASGGASNAGPMSAGVVAAEAAPAGALAGAQHAEAPAPSSRDLEVEVLRREVEIDRLAEREQGLVQAVERRRAEIAEIAEREDALVQRLRQAREELGQVEQQVAAAGAAEARLAELSVAETSTTQEVDRRRAELADLDREVAELHARTEAERAEQERVRAAVDQVREDHAAAAAEADETARVIEDLTRRREDLAREHDALTQEHEDLVRRHSGVVAEHGELTRLYEDLTRRHDEVAGQLEARRAELQDVETRLAEARTELVDLGERVAAQELGLYDYKHPAEDSVVLATQLARLREAIVETLRAGEAITAPTNFKLGHSAAKGQQVVAEVSALSLRAYNAEAENGVRTAGPGGIDGALTRLIRARDAVARHGAWLGVAITDRYHALRAQEIEMAGEYKIRKEREAAAAPAAGSPGGVVREYIPGDGTGPREYVPGAGTGYGAGGPGYVPGTSGPSYGASWESPSPTAPVTSNGRSGH